MIKEIEIQGFQFIEISKFAANCKKRPVFVGILGIQGKFYFQIQTNLNAKKQNKIHRKYTEKAGSGITPPPVLFAVKDKRPASPRWPAPGFLSGGCKSPWWSDRWRVPA